MQNVTKLWDEFVYLKDYPKSKKKCTYWKKHGDFVVLCHKLFDIKSDCSERIKIQEKLWGTKMTEKDLQFYKNMCLVPQVGNRDATPQNKKSVKICQKICDFQKKSVFPPDMFYALYCIIPEFR